MHWITVSVFFNWLEIYRFFYEKNTSWLEIPNNKATKTGDILKDVDV